jgi:hypothetical protein
MVSNQSTLSETGSRHGSTNQSQRRSTSIWLENFLIFLTCHVIMMCF